MAIINQSQIANGHGVAAAAAGGGVSESLLEYLNGDILAFLNGDNLLLL